MTYYAARARRGHGVIPPGARHACSLVRHGNNIRVTQELYGGSVARTTSEVMRLKPCVGGRVQPKH